MECEQRGLLEHEIAVLKGLADLESSYGTKMIFDALTKHVAAMRLATTNDVTPSYSVAGEDDSGTAELTGSWCMCRMCMPSSSFGPGQNTITETVLYAKELCLASHVLVTAHAGDPASLCEVVENFGEDILASPGTFFKVADGITA